MTINLYLVLNCFVQNAWGGEKKKKKLLFIYFFIFIKNPEDLPHPRHFLHK